MEINAVWCEKARKFLKKQENRRTVLIVSAMTRYMLKGTEISMLKGHLPWYVWGSTIVNCQDPESIKTSNGWMEGYRKGGFHRHKYIHTHSWDGAVKEEWNSASKATQMELEVIVLSKIHQAQKDEYALFLIPV